MGACESEKRMVKLKESKCMKNIIEVAEFYDVIVNIQSIKDIIKGWDIKLNKRIKNYEDFINIKENEKVLKIGILGNSNKGKTFILSKLSHISLFGTSIKTEGLSIKYPDLEIYKNRKIALLDPAGFETPVTRMNKNEKGKEDKNINIDKEEEEGDYFAEKSREKLITELFLQNYIIHNSDILIVVVGLLTYSEQKLLNKIKYELKSAKLNKTLYVIHNLMTYTTIQQVETYINDILLKSATFELEKHIQIDTKTESKNGLRFYEKNSNPPVFHLIFANEYSEAGKYYNEYTLSFLENSFEKITDLKGFDIISTIKERFKVFSEDFIENFNDEIEFDDSNKSLIKLKKPKEIKLKKLFIDKLEFTNINTRKFEPNYNYYYNKTNKQIIVNVEAPGSCKLVTSIKFCGEYIIIKISGNKNNDDETSIINERKFGPFSLDIPLKLKDFIKDGKKLLIKNQKPKIEKKDGIFIIVYQLEENCLTGSYSSNY